MTKELRKLIVSITVGAVYAILFAGSWLGINVLMFSIVIAGVAWWQFPLARGRREVALLMGSTIITAVFYTWHHSMLAIFAHRLSVILLIGFLQVEVVRFVWFGFLMGLASLFEVPRMVFKQVRDSLPPQSALLSIRRWVPFIVLPVVLALLFGGIYYQANPNFARVINFVWPDLDWIKLLQSGVFWNLLIGISLAVAIMENSMLEKKASYLETLMPGQLERRKRPGRKVRWFRLLGLKREYWAAISTLVVLNLLLFFANIADLRYVWIDFGRASPQELSQYVHEGTSLLILAILLAMGVLLWYFRGNLNFFPDKGLLRLMAYIWLAQNAMLALSVGLRNWQYVQHYGLAYLRLGVFWFLALVAFGLLSMYLKLRYRRSIFYLLRQNSWALLLSLLLISGINWDNIITCYNLSADTRELDTYFLFSTISDKNIALLWTHRATIAQKSELTSIQVKNKLYRKQQRLLTRIKYRDWRGWNVIDTWNYKALKEMGTF